MMMSYDRQAYLALVHHGNQALITDGYTNREGLTEVLAGFSQVLELHRTYQLPLHLHLSGTLMAAIAWQQPEFYALVRELIDQGLLEVIGSCYGQNIMPFFSAQHNLQQLNEELQFLQRHLGCVPQQVRTAWIPERVWDTLRLAPVLESAELLNQGYRYVMLDDRLLYPAGAIYAGSPRAAFDHSRRWVFRIPVAGSAARGARNGLFPEAQNFLPHRIAGTRDLIMLPISCDLRHLIPPECPDDWKRLAAFFQAVARRQPTGVAIYGDDLEKVAGVGPWGRAALYRYDQFLAWLKTNPSIKVVLLQQWLQRQTVTHTVEVEPGAFYELAQAWHAGEDYRGWWDNDAWRPYRKEYQQAEQAIVDAHGGDSALLDLAWQHLLSSTYESGWHSNYNDDQEPAPWIKAAARHARATHILTYAATWSPPPPGAAQALLLDLDNDGEPELVLGNDRLLAVFSPRWGGRMTFCFALAGVGSESGSLVVGNPSDDWNWQQELHRYMDQPRNHPGAFADVGAEHDAYQVQSLQSGPCAEVVLVNQQAGSQLYGMRKVLRLAAGASHVEVQYQQPRAQPVATEAALSPNYSRLLREGRASLAPYAGCDAHYSWSGWRDGATQVWLATAHIGGAVWQPPAQAECGHGLMVRLGWSRANCTLYFGVGEAPETLKMTNGQDDKITVG